MSRRYELSTTESITLKELTCDSCGYSRKINSIEATDEIHCFTVNGGFWSKYPDDMEVIKFELCGRCLKKIVKEFDIKVESSYSLPFGG